MKLSMINVTALLRHPVKRNDDDDILLLSSAQLRLILKVAQVEEEEYKDLVGQAKAALRQIRIPAAAGFYDNRVHRYRDIDLVDIIRLESEVIGQQWASVTVALIGC